MEDLVSIDNQAWELYDTKKDADIARATSPWHSISDKIVKIDGKYTLMTEEQRKNWEKRKNWHRKRGENNES